MAALVREVVGDVLRGARMSQGRTLREVSDSARVSLGYLSEIERGRKEPSTQCDLYGSAAPVVGGAHRCGRADGASRAPCPRHPGWQSNRRHH
ncbi:transcriptional regulator ClgR [Mycobacterium tuberculosis OFXR-15]|nr:transcriptional regulator ClgR [Mycobacterium tuberculosis OFXR-15]KBX93963.1 transcriptional regulator ClgR [Mycobacterium tuberculosis OFXR-16]